MVQMQEDRSDSPLTIGLDIGTTNIKGAAFTLHGTAVAAASVPTVSHSPRPGWTSYRPAEMWEAAVRVIRTIAGQIEAPERIAGIAVASMAEAGVLLDARGEPVSDIIAWFDRRSAPQLAWLTDTIGADRLTRITGLVPDAKFSLSKLLWHRAEEPEVFSRARRWLHLADFIAYRLCGVPATDWSLASRTLAFDLRALRWSDEILDAAVIPTALLAPSVASGTPIGRVRSDAGALTGLPAGCTVATGGHDHLCGALAVGITLPGAMLDSLGTAEALLICTDRPVDAPAVAEAGYNQGAHVARGMFYVNGSVQSFGRSLDSLRALTGPEATLETLLAEAASVPPGAQGVRYLPHRLPAGAVDIDSRSGGMLTGPVDGATPAVIARSVLEGLAFAARSGFEPLAALNGREQFPEITVIGGGARNELLLRIKAAVMRTTLRVPDVREAAALGAAMLAAIGAGLFIDVADALRQIQPDVCLIEPDPTWMDAYARIYEQSFRPMSAEGFQP